jgi:hypothetical protein
VQKLRSGSIEAQMERCVVITYARIGDHGPGLERKVRWMSVTEDVSIRRISGIRASKWIGTSWNKSDCLATDDRMERD